MNVAECTWNRDRVMIVCVGMCVFVPTWVIVLWCRGGVYEESYVIVVCVVGGAQGDSGDTSNIHSHK